MESFFVYMIRCADQTIYVGHTDNLEKRWAEHQTGELGGYTATRHPLEFLYAEEFPTRIEALEQRLARTAVIRTPLGDDEPAARTEQRSGEPRTRDGTSSAGPGA